MDVMEAIRTRRSIRSYRPDPIPPDVLQGLLESLRLAPSSGNRQPWKFVVVTDVEKRQALARAARYLPGRPEGHAFVADAPVAIVACGYETRAGAGLYRDGQLLLRDGATIDREMEARPGVRWTTLPIDLAIALDHFSLAATEQGLGTCMIVGLIEDEVKRVLSIPEPVRAPLLMSVGYPLESPAARPRKPVEEVICFERFTE